MSTSPSLESYTETQCLDLLNALWAMDMPEHEHNEMVALYDALVGKELGADALFHPTTFDGLLSPLTMLNWIKSERLLKGQPGFSREVSALEPVIAQRNELRQQHAVDAPVDNADLRKIAINLETAEQRVDISAGHLSLSLAPLENTRRTGSKASAAPSDWTRLREQCVMVENRLDALEDALSEYAYAIRRPELADIPPDEIRMTPLDGIVRDEDVVMPDLHQLQRRKALHLARWREAERYATAQQERARSVLGWAEALLRGHPTETGLLACYIPTQVFGPLLMRSDIMLMSAFGPHRLGVQRQIEQTLKNFMAVDSAQLDPLLTHAAKLLSLPLPRFGDNAFAFSTPARLLSAMHNWSDIAASAQTAAFSLRMNAYCTIEFRKNVAQINLNRSNDPARKPKVRVRQAAWDEQHQGYRFTTELPVSVDLLWLHSADFHRGPTTAKTWLSMTSKIALFNPQAASQAPPDDYIICFPKDAGLEPLYVVVAKELAD
jgi:hypothetical protein